MNGEFFFIILDAHKYAVWRNWGTWVECQFECRCGFPCCDQSTLDSHEIVATCDINLTSPNDVD